MIDLAISLPRAFLPKFHQIDHPCKDKAPNLCGLSSSTYGNPCTVQVHRHTSRVRKLTQIEAAKLSTVTPTFDRELRAVLELASDDELSEVWDSLYGQSFLSPWLKSITYNDYPQDALVQAGDPEARQALMERLESRFLFLAADAKDTLTGRRPSYRNVLLQVRKKLKVPCSTKLSTEDIEAEIFLHLLKEYSRPRYSANSPVDYCSSLRPDQSQGHILAIAKLGAEELLSVILKGGSAMTISKLQHLLAKRLSGKMVLEAAKCQLAKQMMKTGGQAVATKLETHVACLAARQGFAGAASRYVAFRSMTMFLGPLLWGTFLADIVIRASDTDYARIVRAIYAFAQIRLTRTYGWTSSEHQLGDHDVET
ncbi:uncharacterized protein LOC131038032 isoform X2 [Cryptomeria japonica]|uniref:uncharacterized protein LOC131038032 isoform X2 n=1 Tax=Cryptomeria japonica TaxID=3369 RepID=UPI0027DA0363|nr:uncharacterized protein LOC131038032 isoform X2 [Cryptomeria japonica]